MNLFDGLLYCGDRHNAIHFVFEFLLILDRLNALLQKKSLMW